MIEKDTELKNVSYELIDKITDKELIRLVNELRKDESAKGLLIELPEYKKGLIISEDLHVC